MSQPRFTLSSSFKPTGDQPKAIAELVNGINGGEKHQTLLGVTGSGKTFTVANVIEHVQKAHTRHRAQQDVSRTAL